MIHSVITGLTEANRSLGNFLFHPDQDLESILKQEEKYVNRGKIVTKGAFDSK